MKPYSIISDLEQKRGATSTEVIIKKRFSDILNQNEYEQAPVWSGPDGVRHQRVTTEENTRKIGIGAISDLESSEADYVHRSFPKFTFFIKKSLVGEIGWNWQDAGKLNKTVVQVGNSSSSFCFDLSNKS